MFVIALLSMLLENVLRSLTKLDVVLASCGTFSGLRQQVKVNVEEFARWLCKNFPSVWS